MNVVCSYIDGPQQPIPMLAYFADGLFNNRTPLFIKGDSLMFQSSKLFVLSLFIRRQKRRAVSVVRTID